MFWNNINDKVFFSKKKGKKKKKKRLSKSLFFHVGDLPTIQVVPFFNIILSKLSLGKENISCSYAIMPNCGRRNEQVGPHKKKKKNGGRRRKSIDKLMQCQFELRGQSGRVEESKVELTENWLILSQFYSTLLLLPLP